MITIDVQFPSEDEIQRVLMELFIDEVKQAVSTVRCPTHHEEVSVTLKGDSMDNLSMEFGGCCEEAIESVKAKLNEIAPDDGTPD